MTLDDLLFQLCAREGSDLHLLDGVRPKIRIHGDLEVVHDEPLDVEELVEPIVPGRLREGLAEAGEADFAHELPGWARFRVNVFRHEGGTGAVFRLIPREIPRLEDLSIPAEAERFTQLRRGLVLVTGPTGSGKSSTLAALIGQINRDEARHIITIEDPIEYVHDDIQSSFTQREVGVDTESFTAALRSAARQDPDLVLVGEMRDRPTIQLALTLAEMGMLVFSTLHTNNAARTIDRIVEVFPEDEQQHVRTMLAQSLEGVLSQILCRRSDIAGRIPATELMFASSAMRNVVREGETHKMDTIFQAGRGRGMHRMDDSLFRLASEGIIDGIHAYDAAEDKARFQRFLPQPG